MNATSTDAANDPSKPKTGDVAKKRRFPYITVIGILGLLGLSLYLIYGEPLGDVAKQRAFGFLCWVFAATWASIWIAIWGPRLKGIRFAPLAIGFLGIVWFFTTYEIVGLTGELWPIIRKRGESRKVASMSELRKQLTPTPTGDQPADADATNEPSAGDDKESSSFTQFLGPNRSGWMEGVTLDPNWEQSPPKELWRIPVGEGWSGFVVQDGYAITMEQRTEEEKKLELVSCYRVADGSLVWVHDIESYHSTVPGGAGPRSTPTIHEGRVFALGATGVLRCLDFKTGEAIWIERILDRVGSTQEQDEALVSWGRSASPLIYKNMVIVPGGGVNKQFKTLLAFNQSDGKPIWEGGDLQISYSSPTIATVAGREQILYTAEAAVCGFDPQDGTMLWSQPWAGQSNAESNTSQVVPVNDNTVLASKGYSAGAVLIQLTANEDGTIQAEEVDSSTSVLKTKFTNLVPYRGHAYALSDGILECVELETLKRKWKKHRLRHGQLLGVGEYILGLGEFGSLHIFKASPDEKDELGKLEVFDNLRCWATLCVVDDLLLMRNSEEAVCLRLPTAK